MHTVKCISYFILFIKYKIFGEGLFSFTKYVNWQLPFNEKNFAEVNEVAQTLVETSFLTYRLSGEEQIRFQKNVLFLIYCKGQRTHQQQSLQQKQLKHV